VRLQRNLEGAASESNRVKQSLVTMILRITHRICHGLAVSGLHVSALGGEDVHGVAAHACILADLLHTAPGRLQLSPQARQLGVRSRSFGVKVLPLGCEIDPECRQRRGVLGS